MYLAVSYGTQYTSASRDFAAAATDTKKGGSYTLLALSPF